MLKKHHASSEKLREVFCEKDCVPETAIDKISKFRGDVIEKTGRFIPGIDLFETEDAYHIDIELPGLAADDINVTVTGAWIRVAGKRSKRTDNGKTLFLEQLEGHFSRALHLDNPIDGANCRAILARGLLHATLPKAAPETIEADEFCVSVNEK